MLNINHDDYMRHAIGLAANAPELPFGAVIIHRRTGEILAEGWNKTEINPTWHGEIDSLNALYRRGYGMDGGELALYTTAEPCPMCMGAILWSGIKLVVFGTSIRFLKKHGWRQIDIFAEEIIRRSPDWECALVGGVLEPECNSLFIR